MNLFKKKLWAWSYKLMLINLINKKQKSIKIKNNSVLLEVLLLISENTRNPATTF